MPEHIQILHLKWKKKYNLLHAQYGKNFNAWEKAALENWIKSNSLEFRGLIAICIFRMRVEEHEVLFIIAIISTIKMTIGYKFKAGLPKCSLYVTAVEFAEAFCFDEQIQQTNTNAFAYGKAAVTGSCW